MSILESLVVSLFCISLVFFVLAVLCGMVKVLSLVLGVKKVKKMDTQKAGAPAESGRQDWDTEAVHASSGELKLKNVDEKTAAMIMAIVSDESKIPLSELCFRSIAVIE